jgi:putative peptidoglycan lipid II flippase
VFSSCFFFENYRGFGNIVYLNFQLIVYLGSPMSEKLITDSPKTVSRSTFAFLSGTLLSRLSGLGRDTAMAITFGSHPAIAAFMVAFRFANLLRRLFGEGPLSSGFIPHFEELRQSSAKAGALFFRDLFFSMSLFLLLLMGGIEGVLYAVLKWGGCGPGSSQIISLTMWMLPGVLFICLFGLSSGLLQCQRRFFLTGFAPVAFNLVWIGTTLLLAGRDPASAVFPLSAAIIVAFFFQWVMLAPQTLSHLRQLLSWKEVIAPRLFSAELRALIKPLGLGIVGVAAVQINTTLDAIFARFASLEGPAYLWYAIRIEQVPLALFGIALSSALLPPLARAIKAGATEQYLQLLRFAFRRSFSLIFPCSLGLFVLGVAGVNLLYGHGGFTEEATYHTVLCLWGYGFGLLPSVLVLLLAPAFYADREFRTPMVASVVSVLCNVGLTSLFVFGLGWGAFSIAIATSLCAWLNYFMLSFSLSKKMGEPLVDRLVLLSFVKTGVSSCIAAGATFLVGRFLTGDPTLAILCGSGSVEFCRGFTMQLMQFAAMSGTFVLIFFSYAWLFNAEDVLELLGLRRR